MERKVLIFMLTAIVPFFTFAIDLRADEEEILIIVNQDTSIEGLGLNTLVDIYTNTRTKWDNGEKIYVCMLTEGPVHESFSKDVIGVAPKKLIRIWKKVIFTGFGTPPKILQTEADMIEYVVATKGAVGYISTFTPYKNVNVFKLK